MELLFVFAPSVNVGFYPPPQAAPRDYGPPSDLPRLPGLFASVGEGALVWSPCVCRPWPPPASPAPLDPQPPAATRLAEPRSPIGRLRRGGARPVGHDAAWRVPWVTMRPGDVPAGPGGLVAAFQFPAKIMDEVVACLGMAALQARGPSKEFCSPPARPWLRGPVALQVWCVTPSVRAPS